MYSLFNLVFLFLFTTIHPKCFCKSCLFLKFYVLHKRSNFIPSFVVHPIFCTLKVYSVLILLFPFCFFGVFCHVLPKTLLQKSFFQKIVGAPWKEQWYCFFRGAPCIDHSQNVKCPDSSFFLFWFATINPNCMCRKSSFLELLGASQKKQWYCFVRGSPCT